MGKKRECPPLTRTEAIEKHRALWNWVADQTEAQRRYVQQTEYPMFTETHVEAHCFCCEYDEQHPRERLCCSECIIDWGDAGYCLPLINQLVSLDANDWETAAELARKIANLPARKPG